MTIKHLLLFAFLFLELADALLAQQPPIHITSLTTKDGLSSNTVNVIVRDQYDWVWIATDDGLARFDGTNFFIYRHQSADPESLRSNEILSLHEDQHGVLWVGTSGGSLSKYDRKRDCFIHFPASPVDHGIRNNVIRSVLSDHTGIIWVAHFDGITLLDPKTGITRNLPVHANSPVKSVQYPPVCMYEDRNKNMWIGTSRGAYRYHPATQHLVYYPQLASAGTNKETVHAIFHDTDGILWFGTTAGLYQLTTTSDRFQPVRLVSGSAVEPSIDVNAIAQREESLWIGTSQGLAILNKQTGNINFHKNDSRNNQSISARQVRSLCIDKQGICWIGTVGGGLNKYDPNLNLFSYVRNNPFDERGLDDPLVSAFAAGPAQTVFVGTEEHGLRRFDPATKLFTRYNIPSFRPGSPAGLNILCLEPSPNNKLLIGTYGDGLLEFETTSGKVNRINSGPSPNQLNSTEIYSLLYTKNGEIWAGTNGQGINVLNRSFSVTKRYTPQPERPNDKLLPINGYIRVLFEDKDSRIWIGTHGGGLAMYEPTTEKFTIYNSKNSGITNNKIQCVLQDKQGDLWIGTFGSGVVRFSLTNETFQSFNEPQGLQNSMAYSLIEDNHGKIWVSTNTGISSIDPATSTILNYNHFNGLQQNNFVRAAHLKLPNGDLYFGGKQGFNYFNPKNLIRNQNIPTVRFTDLRISNQSVAPSPEGNITDHISVAKEINLDFKQNFALDFVGLNYTAPQQNKYAYKLEGFDKDWNYVDNRTTASYTNLDPGAYTFRVKASNNDGIWNEEGSSIKVVVHPPFWRTIYAYILYAAIALGVLLYIRYLSLQKWQRKFALEQDRIRAEQEKREVERILELDQLKIKFLTNLSHEFRTPISLILGPVESLLKKQHEESENKQLLLVKHNARRLLNLVNQLLDFRKMEEQELKLNPTEGNLLQFMDDISLTFKDLAERKKIGFSYTSLIDKMYTRFDHDKLERILFNILSNAFKFTNKGGSVHMTLNWAQLPDEPGTWVEINVADTGIGIPEDQQEKIFELFFQHTSATTILNQGTGIGLSITKEFVRLHGGIIKVESTIGKGSNFTIQLPLEPIEHTENTPDQEELPEATEIQPRTSVSASPIIIVQTERPKVLLVEDDDDFRYYLKGQLSVNYNVVEAVNGKEGWQKALSHHPQLIVSDISMPEMDGIQFCRKIRSDKRTKHIPIILLTALTGEDDQLAGLRTGANDYITKPFNIDLLHAKLMNLLDLNNTLRNTYSKQIKTLPPEVAAQSADEKLMTAVIQYLEENINNTQLSVEELSRHIGMSRSSLYNKLLEITGQTPVEFIRTMKLEKAAALLEKSDLNVAEIAYSVGFSTPNYFAKSFKAKYNMLPSEYMAKVRRENAS